MTTVAPPTTPHVGIFWLVQTPDGKARLLTAGCPLDQAEPYSDCLTYAPATTKPVRTGARQDCRSRPARHCAVLRIRRLAASRFTLTPIGAHLAEQPNAKSGQCGRRHAISGGVGDFLGHIAPAAMAELIPIRRSRLRSRAEPMIGACTVGRPTPRNAVLAKPKSSGDPGVEAGYPGANQAARRGLTWWRRVVLVVDQFVSWRWRVRWVWHWRARILERSPRISRHCLFRPRDFRVPLPEYQKRKYR